MKICYIVDSYPTISTFEGVAAFTRTAALALAARGHEIHVLIARRETSCEAMDGPVQLHIRRVRWLPLLAKWLPGLNESLGVARALTTLHRQFHFDVVEFPNWEGIGLISLIFPVTRSVVRIYTSMAESVEMARRPPTPGERFMMWAERTSTRRANRVITHSHNHEKRMRATYGLGEIDVIRLGIPLPPPSSMDPPAGEIIPQEGTPPLAVLTIGPLNARKGAPTLLEAIPLVLKHAPQTEFWIVGGSEDHALAKQFRAKNPNAAGVKFLGFVENAQLADLYSRCAVYVSASIYESFGLTFVEAMAHRKPVIGCSAGAIPELIEHEKNGLLTPPRDANAFAEAILRLLKNPEERHRFGQAGEILARTEYSDTRMAANVERFFEDVVRG